MSIRSSRPRVWHKLDSGYWRVDLGEGAAVPFVVAGFGEDFDAGRVLGREILPLCTLKPKIVAGLESCGMFLAARDSEHSSIALTKTEISKELRNR